MKTRFVFLLVMCLILSGCGVQTPTDQDSPVVSSAGEPQQSDSSVCLDGFTLGMTPDQLFDQIGISNLEIEVPDYSEIPLPADVPNAVEDGRIYNMTDFSFYYKLKGYDTYFTFSPEGQLITITNWDADIRSDKGLKIGSSRDEAIAIYGSAYAKDPEDVSVLQYCTPDGYFRIFYEGGTVTGWSLSEYENINND